jgi:hypothetical protein
MDTAPVLISQYRAALAMLRQAIAACPDALWDSPDDKARFWHVAYHALFYTHLYLQDTLGAFRPWSKHRQGSHRFDAQGDAALPYDRATVLEYLDLCVDEVQARVPQIDLAAPSGFEWLPFDKLELQIYSIRHVQQHAGELMERLGSRAGLELDWVGKWEG